MGKTFVDLRIGRVFYHEDTTGTQWHQKLNSPGGIDTCVLEWMEAIGVQAIWHWHQRDRMLYRTTPERVRLYGVKATTDERERYYLPVDLWQAESRHNKPQTPYATNLLDLEPKPKAASAQLELELS